MIKVVKEAQKKLWANHNNDIRLERISGSLLRIIYNTSVYPYVDNHELEDLVAETGTGGYAVADTKLRSHGIITISFNTTENPEYAKPMYEQVLDRVIEYIKTCIE